MEIDGQTIYLARVLIPPRFSRFALVSAFTAWLAITAICFGSSAEVQRWRKACAGIDRGRDPGGWCTVAEQLVLSLYGEEGGRTEAKLLQREIFRLRTAYNGPDHPRTLQATARLAEFLSTESDYSEAEVLYRKAMAGLEKKAGLESEDVDSCYRGLARLLTERRNYAGAQPLWRRLAAWDDKSWKPTEAVPESSRQLADVCKALGDYAGAEPLYRRVLESRKAMMGNNWLDVAEIASSYSQVCEKLNRKADAVAYAREAVELASHEPSKVPLILEWKKGYENQLKSLEAAR